jgi:hypothetical protein
MHVWLSPLPYALETVSDEIRFLQLNFSDSHEGTSDQGADFALLDITSLRENDDLGFHDIQRVLRFH